MAFQGDSIYWVEVEKVVPNPFQPRREFDEKKLQELADSIRMYGVLQPLTVTRKEVQQEDGTFYTEYELIAGERRLRASKLAGTSQVPVIIREGEQSEQEKLELAIIENLQREDLNAVDRALAFKQLAEVFSLSHAQVAQKVGRSREYVSNTIRLLGLPDHMLDSLKHGDMSEGHARTLLMLNDKPEEQEVIYKEILLKKLSVREVERIVRKVATDKVRKKLPGELDSNLIEYEKQFTETLGTRVQIQKTGFGGKLTIDYFSVDDLEAILERMKQEEQMRAQEEPKQHEMVERLAAHTPLDMSEVPQAPAAQAYAEPEPAQVIEELPVEPEVQPHQFAQSEPVQQNNEPERAHSEPEQPAEERVQPRQFAQSEPVQQNNESELIKPEQPKEEVTPESHQPPVESELAPTEEQKPEEQPKEEKSDTDESGLYSIRNFTV